MSADYVIHTPRPDLCVDFYTRVMGLQFEAPRRDRTIKNTSAPLVNKDTFALWEVGIAEEASLLHNDGDSEPPTTGSMFKINHSRIAPVRRNAALRHIHAQALPRVPGSAGVDMFFLARHPLDAIYQHMQALGWMAVSEPMKYIGAIHHMRILYLLDPDGNRLRLVELAA